MFLNSVVMLGYISTKVIGC